MSELARKRSIQEGSLCAPLPAIYKVGQILKASRADMYGQLVTIKDIKITMPSPSGQVSLYYIAKNAKTSYVHALYEYELSPT